MTITHDAVDGNPTGAVWLELGRLRLIWCAPPRPGSLGHPNKWMLVWRRRLPEWDRKTQGQYVFTGEVIPDGEKDWIAADDPHEVAMPLPALEKIKRDLEYHLPESGRPLAYVALSREQAIELLAALTKVT
jgi:hypothetical protein